MGFPSFDYEMKNHGLTAVVSAFHASHEPLCGSLLSSPSFQMGNSRWIKQPRRQPPTHTP